MKKLLVVVLVTAVFSTSAFAQEETRRHSSGPRRQLATIVFAGLGGAILGLSTLSFYGRPQDQLSNIAIGFAVGVIAGTAYVTVRSATTRDYYDSPQGALSPGRLPQPLPVQLPDAGESQSIEEQTLVYAPLLTKVTPDTTAYGAQLALRF